MDRRTLCTPTGTAVMVTLFLGLPVSWAADPNLVTSRQGESHGDSAVVDERIVLPADTSLQVPAAEPSSSSFGAIGAVEVERRFNELRRELLDDRAKTIDWWLMGTAIVLAAFGFIGFVGVKEFREIKSEARGSAELAMQHAEDARTLLEKIRAQHDEAVSHVSEVTTKVQDSPARGRPERGPLSKVVEMVPEVRRIAERVAQDPEASAISRAVAAAVKLQERGSLEESIERWRAVAIVSEESDKDLAAQAWFSVGYLCRKHDKGASEKAIDAYSRAIGSRPDFAGAYNNRGVSKASLDRLKEAIEDYDEAIREAGPASPGLAEALDRTAAERTRLRYSCAAAYFNRGVANACLKRMDEGRADLEAAISLTRDKGDEAFTRAAEDVLKLLDKEAATH